MGWTKAKRSAAAKKAAATRKRNAAKRSKAAKKAAATRKRKSSTVRGRVRKAVRKVARKRSRRKAATACKPRKKAKKKARKGRGGLSGVTVYSPGLGERVVTQAAFAKMCDEGTLYARSKGKGSTRKRKPSNGLDPGC